MATRFPLDTALSHLYDAAANASLWPEVSAALSSLVNADLAFMQVRPAPDDLQILSTNFSPDIWDVSAKWAVQDPWYMAALPRVRNRGYLGHELVPDRIIKETAFYHEFLKPVLGATHFFSRADPGSERNGWGARNDGLRDLRTDRVFLGQIPSRETGPPRHFQF